jgi:hypothetical protein
MKCANDTPVGWNMEIIDNVNRFLGDDLKRSIIPGARVAIAASSFSIYAFEALKQELERIRPSNSILSQERVLMLKCGYE